VRGLRKRSLIGLLRLASSTGSHLSPEPISFCIYPAFIFKSSGRQYFSSSVPDMIWSQKAVLHRLELSMPELARFRRRVEFPFSILSDVLRALNWIVEIPHQRWVPRLSLPLTMVL